MRASPRRPFRPLILAASFLSLAGCGITGQTPQAQTFPSFSPRPTVAVASPNTNGVQQVRIEAANTRFVPSVITAHPGTLDITVQNTDQDVHNLTVFTTSQEDAAAGTAGTDAVSTDDIAADKTTVLRVTLTKPGTYRFFCKFHRSEGMFGQLTIT